MTPQEAAAAVRDLTAQLGERATDYLTIRTDIKAPSTEIVVLMIYPEGMLSSAHPLYVRAASFETAIAAMSELVARTLRARNDALKERMVAEIIARESAIVEIADRALISAGFSNAEIAGFGREAIFVAASRTFRDAADTCGVAS